ncbi:hypothetical protein HFN76_18935 [Rhizobium laguerreae]|uniref:hypothetical protein n=1 Tax=Rhizobium laguerreae TaxID=1076926 RepID=UPI001C916724|nr:hypothetical protein [Rhizobium laguerreae]MBY3514288.1 hypothetical protein [Rhizobium laguerreae]
MKKPAPIKPLDPVLADFIRALARDAARRDHEICMRSGKVLSAEELAQLTGPEQKGRGRNPAKPDFRQLVENDEQFWKAIFERMESSLFDLRDGCANLDRLSKSKKTTEKTGTCCIPCRMAVAAGEVPETGDVARNMNATCPDPPRPPTRA